MVTRRSILKAGLSIPVLTMAAGVTTAHSEAKTHEVVIENFEFSPDSLDVKPGDKVVFINNDVVPHTATEKDGAWDSGDLSSGDKWEYTVEGTGTINYYCVHHPVMLGSLTSK